MSLLFSESPVLGAAAITVVAGGILVRSNAVIAVGILCILFLLYFYRYAPLEIGPIDSSVMLSPCEGKVLTIMERDDYLYVAIFLSPFNRHTQIYPANCRCVDRRYDHTGQFDIVLYLDKSKDNEKLTHWLQLDNGAVMTLTQIAGFLPRMITSSDDIDTNYKAGDYLGMIKFGSRIDLLIPRIAPDGSVLQLALKPDDTVSIGDYIGRYIK